ncbi:MAG TPA: hypothetical protein VMZ50_12220, partial [Phycisphaerae bacterium]|nr:hypothetical protein [Phycisphaerae bacterium]
LVGPLTRLKDAVAELQRSRIVVDRQELVNVQRIAAKFEKMGAEEGGGILAGMCANNQVDDVVKILYYMSDRSAAKMLAGITDRSLAARLTGLMQKIKEEG